MAKKNIAGVGGAFTTFTGFNGNIASWSATYTIDTEEVTGFDSGGFRQYEPVAVALTGSASGTVQYDGASASPVLAALADGAVLAVGDLEGAKGTLTLTAITGCTWAFSGIFTSIAIDRPAAGKASITFNFLSNGPITQTWDET